MSDTGNEVAAKPISAASACGLSIGIKVIFEIIMQKYSNTKNNIKENEQNIKSFEELYGKSLQDSVFDKN